MIARRLLTQTGPALALLYLVSALPGNARADAAEPAPQVIHVGAHQTIKTIADAARLARAGTTIDVDSGTYAGDVAVWTQDNLTLRAAGGRVRLLANGAAAEGKAIWVVRAHGMRMDGFDFEGAAVPNRNGAGIRLDDSTHNPLAITITLTVPVPRKAPSLPE